MDAPLHDNSPILAAYRAHTPASAAAFERASELFPGGVTHDSRLMNPYPLTVVRAKGARKWDADGNEYVDYFGGHGALILGHGRPEVVAAAARQLELGTHYGANHDLEIEWAELVKAMVPSAERVRFTGTGTEATLLALRLARAATGRRKLLRLRGHFHGWHDHMAFGVANHFDGTPTPGVLDEVAQNVVLVDPNDAAGLVAALDAVGDEIAAAILEPTGSTYGQVPLAPAFVELLRAETAKRGIVLVFDEVVTGFRVARGGAQEALGITPDLTTLAKILAGGLPGGAVVGRADLVDQLDPGRMAAKGGEKIPHQGTFNANPVSAAAGIATLRILQVEDAVERAHAFAKHLRDGMNAVLADLGVPWVVYGRHTGCHLFVNPEGRDLDPQAIDRGALDYRAVKAASALPVVRKLRLAMRVEGVDFTPWPGGPTSAAHGPEELAVTLDAFRHSLLRLREERELPA